MKRLRWIAPLLGVMLLVSACSSGGSGPSPGPTTGTSGVGGTVTISNESGGLWTCGFNPFNPSVSFLAVGVVYEPLIYNDILTGTNTPWLATGYQWGAGNRSLTFTIRSGVTWSDGTPLTAADVVYTFNLLKRYPALDLNAVWSVLASVTQQGSNKVVMTFSHPAVPFFYYIADQVPIVPQHIWSKLASPVTYKDSQPVGTGPYTVQQCTPENIAYIRNPHYWQPGLPKIAKVEYPAFTSNPPANTLLATGGAQWGGQFIPNIKAFFVAKDPAHRHYWFAPTENVDLYINQTVYPLNVRAVRQALAYGINRPRVSQIAEYGYEPPGNQTGVVLPTFRSWYDSQLASQYNYTYDPAKAIQLLRSAGFTRGSSGVFQTPSGKPLSFTIVNEGGNSDWVAALQMVKTELAAVGISIQVDNLSAGAYDTALYDGHYQLGYGFGYGGPTPYYELRAALFSGDSAPIGHPAASNFERWRSAQTDSLISQYASTTSVSVQHQIVDQLEKIMLQDVPLIPVTEAVDWYQYNTRSITGWPTPSNPYAQAAPYNFPDWEVVLLHLKAR